MRINISPLGVARFGGLPLRAVTNLTTSMSMHLVAELQNVEQLIGSLEPDVSAHLFELVGSSADKPLRRLLVEVRRDLHNRRPLSPSTRAKIEERLTQMSAMQILKLSDLIENHAATYAQYASAFEQELAISRLAFAPVVAQEEFRRGVLLSSQSLFSNLKRYLHASGSSLSSRDEHIERGLLRYASRASTKTSPFSTFASLAAVRIVETPPTYSGPELRVSSVDFRRPACRVILNKAILGIFLTHLRARPETRRHLPLAVNSTVWREEDHVCWLSSEGSRELFCRVARSDSLEKVLARVRSADSATIESLVVAMRDDPDVDASEVESNEYLNGLVDLGLLRVGSGVRDQDLDWDLTLRTTLESPRLRLDAHCQIVCEALRQLRDCCAEYAAGDSVKREVELKRALQIYATACAALGTPGVLGLGLFLEDCGLGEIATLAVSESCRSALDAFARFVSVTSHLAPPREWQISLRHFLDTTYPDEDTVPILPFFEAFHRREVRLHEQSGLKDKDSNQPDYTNPFQLRRIAELQRQRGTLANLIREKWRLAPLAEEISVSLCELADALNVDDARRHIRPFSASAFAQFATLNGRSVCVVPNGAYYAGFGKYFSRFLHVLPQQFAEEVRAENVQSVRTASDVVLAEICADENFNANLHPSLVGLHIPYPAGDVSERDAQLPLDEIEVARDPHDPEGVILQCPRRGYSVVPVDLGFMNPGLRPPLFQFLSKFCPLTGTGFWMPDSPAALKDPSGTHRSSGSPGRRSPDNAESTADSKPRDPWIECRPRICFDNKVILARRRWSVPPDLFPHRRAGESQAEYFLRVQKWRTSNGIPSRAFVRVAWLPASGPSAARDSIAATPDPRARDRVPQSELEKTEENVSEGPSGVPRSDDSTRSTDHNAGGEKSSVSAARGSRDFAKPQFIDFNSPLFVSLFERICGQTMSVAVLIEECLPDVSDDHLICTAGRVAEFVFQFGCCDP